MWTPIEYKRLLGTIGCGPAIYNAEAIAYTLIETARLNEPRRQRSSPPLQTLIIPAVISLIRVAAKTMLTPWSSNTTVSPICVMWARAWPASA